MSAARASRESRPEQTSTDDAKVNSAEPAARFPSGFGRSPAELLRLQRLAGNQVVNVLLGAPHPVAERAVDAAGGLAVDGGPGTAAAVGSVATPDDGRVRRSAVAGSDAAPPRTAPRSLRGVRRANAVATPRSQMVQRRVPDDSELRQLIKTEFALNIGTGELSTVTSSPLADEHAEGLRTVLRRQIVELRAQFGPATNVMKVIEACVPGMTVDNAIATGTALDLLRLAENIVKQNAASKLQAPEGYMAPPANSVEQLNIKRLVDNAGAIFALVANGSKDAAITEIFGASHVGEAKLKMANGKAKMLDLFANNKIVTDRSGYSGEVLLGGMSMFNVNVLMPSGAIDNPDHGHSIATMFHEAMHAGNADVKDNGGYVGSPGFQLKPEALKIVNAAHFEVIALRHLLGPNPVWDGVFSPPGAVIGGAGGVVPEPTDTETALMRVSEMFRRSWTASLWLHDDLLNVYKDPTLWSKQRTPAHLHSQWLSYWSPVLGLTIHKRVGSIDPLAPGKDKRPVSQIDMALIEGIAKRFGHLGQAVPKNEVDAYKNLAVYPGGSPWKYVFQPEVEADALAADLLVKARLMDDPVRDKALVDDLCLYFSRATGTPMLSGQHQPSDYPK